MSTIWRFCPCNALPSVCWVAPSSSGTTPRAAPELGVGPVSLLSSQHQHLLAPEMPSACSSCARSWFGCPSWCLGCCLCLPWAWAHCYLQSVAAFLISQRRVVQRCGAGRWVDGHRGQSLCSVHPHRGPAESGRSIPLDPGEEKGSSPFLTCRIARSQLPAQTQGATGRTGFNHRTMESGSHGIMESQDHRAWNCRIMELIVEPWNCGITES